MYSKAYELFDRMIMVAKKELFEFTLNQPFVKEQKADKSVVTACDKAIDKKISAISKEAGFAVVSEEGEHTVEVVKTGSYLTIDPIDGTLGYIDYVNDALAHGDIANFLKKDLGSLHDFCLLVGIVANGIPQYGLLYNYVTEETILVDGNDTSHLVRKNNIRNYTQQYAAYIDQYGKNEELGQLFINMPEVSIIKQATVGLKSLYALLNAHEAAVMPHRAQASGLWDILPAAVAARAFGGEIYDDLGNPLRLDTYAVIPGKGVTVIKGEKFQFVKDILKGKPTTD